MQAGHQTSSLSFWEHGSMVAARFRDLMNQDPHMTWRLPAWFTEHADSIRKKLLPDFELIMKYQQWHDLGKPHCRTLDDAGKVHYPDHATVSATIWHQLGGDPKIGKLIGQDMLCHQLRPAEAAAFAANPNALTLLITALCELHANASMFGGIQSDSFKIKFKRLDRCGAIILKLSKDLS
jgi:hypothetical protein